jgi:uncharacterized protein (DUF924 family)
MTDLVIHDPAAVLAFWREAGPQRWFSKDESFDRRFRERFLASHEAATKGELDHWLGAPESALALVLLLDQFPRNAFRDSPRMYATDEAARKATSHALVQGFDEDVQHELRVFFYLPLSHAEDIAAQERAVALNERIGKPWIEHALEHRDIIRRFGRFPHRNAILGRTSTDAEKALLAEGGFAG